MTLVRFAIDEGAFTLDGQSAARAAEIVRSLLETMRDLDAAGHNICFDLDLVVQPIWGGISFWELFRDGSEVPLTTEDFELAAAQFSKAARWEETGDPQPDEVDVRVGQRPPEISGSLAWTHAQGSKKLQAAACISSSAKRTMGSSPVTVGGVTRDLWFVETNQQIKDFFRHLLVTHAESPNDIDSLSSDAFPDLDFGTKSFDGIKSMSKPLLQLAPAIIWHLSVLSDNGQEIFRGPWQDASAQFGSRGVNISDENGNTKQNANARKQRTVKQDGVDRICWWHTKLELDRDRIHLDPTLVTNGGRIFVGIFCRHLDT